MKLFYILVLVVSVWLFQSGAGKVWATDGELPAESPVPSPSSEPLASPSPSPVADPSPSPSPITASETTPSPTPNPDIIIDQTLINQAEVLNQATQSAVTGHNLATSTDTITVDTNTATASSQIETILNNTTVGENQVQDIVQISQPGDGPIDLSQSVPGGVTPTQTESGETPVASVSSTAVITNQADVTNQVTVAADTGHNFVEADSSQTDTGSAMASSQLFNFLNTTTVGECGYLGVINIWSEWHGDIILPNQVEYLEQCQVDEESQSITQSEVMVDNQAEVVTDVATSAQTGGNQVSGATEVVTGAANATSQSIEKSNTVLQGDEWWLVRVTNPEYWRGTFRGEHVEPYQIGNTWYFGWQPTAGLAWRPSSPIGESTQKLQITNQAHLNNQVDVSANTGGNQIGGQGARLTTGDAEAWSQVISYLNTVIVGNRWYLADINLLAPFQGDVVMAKPDVVVMPLVSAVDTFLGERKVIGFRVVNQGQSRATGVSVRVQLPVGVKARATDPASTLHDQEVWWEIGDLAAGGYRDVFLVIEAEQEMKTATITSYVVTTMTEHTTQNNLTTLAITARSRPVVTRVTQAQAQVRRRVNTLVTRRPVTQLPQVVAAADGGVLGATTDRPSNLVASLPTLNDATPTSQRFCDRSRWVCQSTQYIFAFTMLGGYIYHKRRYIDWW